MEHDVTRNYAGSEMSQTSLEGFFKNLSAAEMKSKEFTEKITKYKEGDGQNSNILSKKKNCQKAGKQKKSYGREFHEFLSFIEVFDGLEEKDIYSLGEEPREVKKEKKEGNTSDQDQSFSLAGSHIIDEKEESKRS